LEAMRSLLDPLMEMEKVVNKNDPRQIRIMVRKPADLLRYSRSAPISPPTRITKANRSSKTSIGGIYLQLYLKIRQPL
jgi:hypothetical protein